MSRNKSGHLRTDLSTETSARVLTGMKDLYDRGSREDFSPICASFCFWSFAISNTVIVMNTLYKVFPAAPGRLALPATEKLNEDFFLLLFYDSSVSLISFVELDELRWSHPLYSTHANHAHATPLLRSIRLYLERVHSGWNVLMGIHHGWPRFQPTGAYSLAVGTGNYRTDGSCRHRGCTRRLSIDGTLVPLVT